MPEGPPGASARGPRMSDCAGSWDHLAPAGVEPAGLVQAAAVLVDAFGKAPLALAFAGVDGHRVAVAHAQNLAVIGAGAGADRQEAVAVGIKVPHDAGGLPRFCGLGPCVGGCEGGGGEAAK